MKSVTPVYEKISIDKACNLTVAKYKYIVNAAIGCFVVVLV